MNGSKESIGTTLSKSYKTVQSRRHKEDNFKVFSRASDGYIIAMGFYSFRLAEKSHELP